MTPETNLPPPPEPPADDDGGWIDEMAFLTDPPAGTPGPHPAPPPPPPEAPADDPATGRHDRAARPARRGGPDSATGTLVDAQMRAVLASLHGSSSTDVAFTILRLRENKPLWKLMTWGNRMKWQGILDALGMFAEGDIAGTRIMDLPAYLDTVAQMVPSRARPTLQDLAAAVGTVTAPTSVLLDILTTRVWAADEVDKVDAYRDALAAPMASMSAAAEKFDLLSRPPAGAPWAPTVLTASDFVAAQKDLNATRGELGSIRIASGMPSLDARSTNRSHKPGEQPEPWGAYKPGEFHLYLAGTGMGKSAFLRHRATAAAKDLHAWGLPDAKVLYLFTEESLDTVFDVMEVKPGQRNAGHSHQIVARHVNNSRRACAEAFYDTVRLAEIQAESTGRPITHFLPYVIEMDYIGGIFEPGENEYVEGIGNTADLVMRGFCPMDFDTIAAIAKVSYRDYVGRDIPKGLDGHQIACVCAAQLRQQDSKANSFDPATHNLADFVAFTRNDELAALVDSGDADAKSLEYWCAAHKAEDGKFPAWRVYKGDQRIASREDAKGASKLLDHATSVVVLHRSRPVGNPPVTVTRPDGSTGRQLGDQRAYLVWLKGRNGEPQPLALRFDSDPQGLRGMYYDPHAIEAARGGTTGDLLVPDGWEPGDAVLWARTPVTLTAEAVGGVRY